MAKIPEEIYYMPREDYEEGTELVQIQGQTFTTKTTKTSPNSVTVKVTNTDPADPIYVQVPPPSSDVVSIPSCWVEGRPPEIPGLKDGGTRTTYGNGAMKEDSSKTAGKGAFHLLPFLPVLRTSEIWRKGAVKYLPRNWEKGIPLSRFSDSGLRHGTQATLAGKIDEDHIHQCIWNFMALSWTIDQINRGNLPATLNDLPSIGGPGDSNYRKPGPAIELKEEQKGKPEKEIWGRELSLEERYIPFMKDDIEYMKEIGLIG
jgi:hypothetical protein